MIVLTLPYPISANRYWAHRVVTPKAGRPMAMTYVTPEAKDYRKAVHKAALAAGIASPLPGRIALDLKLYPHRPLDFKLRMRKLGALWDDSVQCIDLGNAEKVLSDALQGVVIGDDKAFRRITMERMEPDDGEARVVVTITQLAVHQPQQSLLSEVA